VQFGANLELCDEIAGCGVHGWFNFDALFIWDPVFSFSIHASAGIAVQVLGDTLMGINFDLTIEGPAPWHVHGSGSIDLFLFSVSLDFEAKWGSEAPALPGAPDIASVLATALAKPSAWVASPPNDETTMVTLSAQAKQQLHSGHLIHPLGGVTVRQRAVPLDIQLSRYKNQPITPQTWGITGAQLSDTVPAALGGVTQDEFPAGEFIDLSEDDKLARPSFERFDSGVSLIAGDVTSGELRKVDTDFETELVPDISLGVIRLFVHFAAERLLTIDDPHVVETLWSQPNLDKVTVLPFQPVAVATTDTLQAEDVPPGTFTSTLQFAESKFGVLGPESGFQLVEQWELAG
jgi:hypothetical protein